MFVLIWGGVCPPGSPLPRGGGGVASLPCHKNDDESGLSLKSQVIQEERVRVIPHPCTFIPGRQWDTLGRHSLAKVEPK